MLVDTCIIILFIYLFIYLFICSFLQLPRTEWVLKWPGQVVIADCQTVWTTEVSEALEKGVLPELYQDMLKQVHNCTCTYTLNPLLLVCIV